MRAAGLAILRVLQQLLEFNPDAKLVKIFNNPDISGLSSLLQQAQSTDKLFVIMPETIAKNMHGSFSMP